MKIIFDFWDNFLYYDILLIMNTFLLESLILGLFSKQILI